MHSLWEDTNIDRYELISWALPPLFPYPVRDDPNGFRAGIDFRRLLGYKTALGLHADARHAKRRIYLDMGARSPGSSIAQFRDTYPDGTLFETFAFEADPSFASMYVGMPNVTFISAAVSTFDGPCHFSKVSSVSAHMSRRASVQTRPITCIDIVRWLKDNIPADALTVAKVDIERAEFDIVPHLLREDATLRLIDEVYIECHHVETWGHRGHSYRECLEMYKAMRSAGVVVHEWF